MKTIRLTTGQALIKFLNNQYIEFDGKETKFIHGIISIFGHGNVIGLGQAIKQDPGDLMLYQGRNEQGIGHVAMGYAKQMNRKKICAVTSSVGPGAANMVTAAATATANRIPVLFLPGDTFASRQPDPVLQQVEQYHSQAITTNDAFMPVSKYWDRVQRPEQLMSAMLNAMKTLTSPSLTGAVTICLPQDVQGEAFDFPVSFLAKRVHIIDRTPPTQNKVEKAADMIKNSKKPIIICGGGVKYSEAHASLKAFCEKHNIPFGETQAGKSAIISAHPLNLGGIGTTGCLSANHIARKADLVIGVGTRYTDFTTASKWLFADTKVININIAEFDSPKLDALPVTCDAKVGLDMISKELGNYKSGYTDEISIAKKDWETELKRLHLAHYDKDTFMPEVGSITREELDEYASVLNTRLTQTEVIGIVNDYCKEDSIVVGAAGSLPSDLQRVWISHEQDCFHMEYGFSCMGYEVAAGLGAKIAKPDKEVFVMLGDGSFQMLHSELTTAIQENKKINLILFDNAQFGCINNLQHDKGIGTIGTQMRKRGSSKIIHDGEIMQIDFAKVGEGYGCKTYSVRTCKELKAALEDAKKQDDSTLLDIKILPKTMTEGYEAFWNACSIEVAEDKNIVAIADAHKEELKNARKY
jgi:3D-(3,5/4)-trihydroxycyclohexane-1,2-dione acylhydrolase (decyclizing)